MLPESAQPKSPDDEALPKPLECTIPGAVLGAAKPTRPMTNRLLDDDRSADTRERRNETVCPVEREQPLQQAILRDPKSASRVAHTITRDPVSDSVSEVRLDPLPERILPLVPDPGHHVRPRFVEQADQPRNVRGIVLQIGIEGDDEVSARRIESRGERSGLAAVFVEPNRAEPWKASTELPQHRGSPVIAAVIDDDDFHDLNDS